MSETTHFGEQTVSLEAKQGMVNDVFHAVADRYDLMLVALRQMGAPGDRGTDGGRGG